MAEDVRLSDPTLRALKFLFSAPLKGRSGAEISKAARIGSGTMYPMLSRLEAAGWVEGQWEEVDPRKVGRPRRRLYTLTMAGCARTQAAFAEYQVAPEAALSWNS